MATDRYGIEFEIGSALSSLNSLRTAVKGFIGVLAVREVVQFGQAIVQSTREFQNYQNQLRLITNGSADLQRVTALLQQTAVDNRTSFGDTVDLFTKLRITTESLGVSEERVINVTSKLSQALQVAGADGNTASSVIRQFGQAMASGEVRGDEFRSLVEGLGPALAIMARESGITVGELRRMSQAGELSAETMFKMLESSKALTSSFNQMQPTISQLETALGDAFDRMMIKIGETSGLTKAYTNVIQTLAREFDKIAKTEGALVNLSQTDVMERVNKGTISATTAIKEFESRVAEIYKKYGMAGGGQFYLFGKPAAEEQSAGIKKLIEELKALEKQQAAKAAKDKAELDRVAELNKKLNEVLVPYQKFIKLGQEYEKLEVGTPLEKAIAKQKEAQQVLNKLREAQQKLIKSGLNTDGLKDVSLEIKAAEKAVKEYGRQIADIIGIQGLDKFYKDLVDGSRSTVANTEYARQSLEKLKKDFEAGKISADIYAEAIKKINQQLEKVDTVALKLAESVREYSTRLLQSSEDAQFEFDKLNMDNLQIQMETIKRTLERDLKQQVTELRKLANENPTRVGEIEAQIKAITDATTATIAQQTRLAEEAYKNQRSFTAGWNKAFREYADNATNAARQAERIFQKTTQGMEDMIVNFAKTGKFEFKSFINSILEELLRSQIQQLIAQIFNTGRSGGGSKSTIGRLLGFANGGIIPTNGPVLVGERGPEILSGAAGRVVTPNNQLGGTNVVYNINAVDAASFKQLVARDPAFLYAVTQQGAKSIPQTRR
jgi:tape measure domain-containing protein